MIDYIKNHPLVQRLNKMLLPAEWILFIPALALALAPVYSVAWYHTGDGPSHLYSAAVMNDILFHSGQLFGRFFDLHWQFVPNTTVLIFQALMLEFFSPALVLKATLLLISLGMTGGYLYFTRSLHPTGKGPGFLVLPLVINYFTTMGFFSFSASLALMLFTAGYYNKTQHFLSGRNMLIITLLLLINWFTHLTGVFFTVGYILLQFLLSGKADLRRSGKMLLLIFPVSLLTFSFGKEALASNAPQFDSMENLQHILVDFSPLCSFHPDELGFIKPFQYLILCLFPLGLFFFFRRRMWKAGSPSLIYCLLLLLAFFMAPLNFFSGGFINYRILFCALLFFCAFIESNIPAYLKIWIIPLLFFILVKKNNFYLPVVESLSADVERIILNTKNLPKGEAIVPMNYSAHWLHYNIALYPAVSNKIVILDNHEAGTINSVIRWRKGKAPGENLGTVLSSNCPVLKLDYEKESDEKISGLLRWQYNSSCSDSISVINDSLLSRYFIPVTNREGVSAFLRK